MNTTMTTAKGARPGLTAGSVCHRRETSLDQNWPVHDGNEGVSLIRRATSRSAVRAGEDAAIMFFTSLVDRLQNAALYDFQVVLIDQPANHNLDLAAVRQL
jgi:hypothetical protein